MLNFILHCYSYCTVGHIALSVILHCWYKYFLLLILINTSCVVFIRYFPHCPHAIWKSAVQYRWYRTAAHIIWYCTADFHIALGKWGSIYYNTTHIEKLHQVNCSKHHWWEWCLFLKHPLRFQTPPLLAKLCCAVLLFGVISTLFWYLLFQTKAVMFTFVV